MYLSAACLIGLRPLLRVTSQWLKSRVVTGQRVGSRKNHKEHGFMSLPVKGNMALRMKLQSFGQDIERGRDGSGGSTGSSDILVLSEIQVTSTEQRPKQDSAEAPNER